MTPVRLEPAAPRSLVKHSTTEPLRSRERKNTLFCSLSACCRTGLCEILLQHRALRWASSYYGFFFYFLFTSLAISNVVVDFKLYGGSISLFSD